MIVSAIGLAAIRAREGVRLTAYRDSVGVWTIGFGHTKGVRPGQRITRAQADALLAEDVEAHTAPIRAAIRATPTENEFDAFASVAFNIGVNAFRNAAFLRRFNAGDRSGCAAAIMLWRKPPEIVSRREAERDQFLTPYGRALPKGRSTDARRVAAPAA